jgi:hypothetical protein
MKSKMGIREVKEGDEREEDIHFSKGFPRFPPS